MKNWLILLSCALLFSSCSIFKPIKIKQPTLPKSFSPHPKLNIEITKELCGPWWKELKNKELDELISKALKSNYDVKIASFKIKELLAASRIERSRKLPSLTLSSTGKLTWFNKSPSPSVPGQQPKNPQEAYTLGLAASYELDLWKKIENSYQASLYKVLSAEWNKKALEMSISAEVANFYYKIAYLSKKIELLKEELRLRETFLKILRQRYKEGLIDLSSVKEAEIAFLEKKSLLSSLKRELYSNRTGLSLLLGSFTLPKIKGRLPQKLPPLPSYLPSDLLKRRPDIIEAEYQIKALNCEYLSKVAQRFPQISLTGFGGSQSTELKDLFSSTSFLWKLAFEVSVPIFNYGKLKAMAEEKKWEVKEAASRYARTVLNAFWEVEKALTNEEELSASLSLQREALNLKKELLKIAQQRYEKGLVDLLELLKAKISLCQAKEELLDVQYSLIANRIFLYRALGGGTEKCQKKLSK
jgi:multidrug efflux system outer membrane protein